MNTGPFAESLANLEVLQANLALMSENTRLCSELARRMLLEIEEVKEMILAKQRENSNK